MESLSIINTVLRLPITPVNPNILKSGYYSFEDRTVDLSKHLISCIDKKLSEYFNQLLYSFDNLEEKMNRGQWDTVSDRGYHELYFKGVYKMENIKLFIGVIPINNQEEIINKMKSIENNPLLNTQDLELLVLAPVNNFASTANVIAIDPIVFCKIYINKKAYLIPLTQWI